MIFQETYFNEKKTDKDFHFLDISDFKKFQVPSLPEKLLKMG